MEPKDLKNSQEELSGILVVPETINDQNVTEETVEQPGVIVLSEVENAVEEVEKVDVENTLESTIQVAEEVVTSKTRKKAPKPQEEVVTEHPVAVTTELPVEEPDAEVDAEIEETVAEPLKHEVESESEVDALAIVEAEVVDADNEAIEEPESAVETLSISEEIPSIEELIDVSEDDVEIHEDDLSDENSPKLKMADYSDLDEIGLITELRALLQNEDFDRIKGDVEAIKISFFRRYRANIEAQKAAFINAGGDLTEFNAEPDPYELDLRNLLKQYQDFRNEHNKKVDESKDDNFQKKYEIIEEIKALINNKESINKTFHDFRELQNRWRETGPVPQAKLKDLWDTYHHHVENFYDYIKINKELRDLDLKKNLETKIEICEKSEELLVEPSIIKAFNVLQKYHEQWREIGPVPRDKKDELWERFKSVTSIINKKHQDYFEGRKSDQKKNLDAKIALCEKVEEISSLEIENHRDWDEKSKELIELQKVWRTIGFAPKKDNNKIYERFRIASDKFFDRKREFYNQNKEEQQVNLQLKIDLCVQAEAMKDNTDWKKTADEFISIQKAWKEIGPVPRKFSDLIWKRFRSACDFFFENKAKHFSSIDGEQSDNLKKKRALLEEVKQFILTGDDNADLEKLKDFQRQFTEIGHVPFKDKDSIQNEFRDLINRHFDTLRIDEKRRNLMKFKSKVANNTTTGRGQNKMRFEREKYMTKLKQMETDLALLDNNIGFFANTKNASVLIDDVNQKIANTKEKIEFLKEKIRIMDAMEDGE